MLSVVRRRGVRYVAGRLGWKPQKVNKYRRGDWTRMYDDSAEDLERFLVAEGVVPATFRRGDHLSAELVRLVAAERIAWEPAADGTPRAEHLVDDAIARAQRRGLANALEWAYKEAVRARFDLEEFAIVDGWRNDEIEGNPQYAQQR
jgi:hypothetical protein